MTIFGWDASNHDWGRGPMDVAAAVRDGIVFATHKVAEGSPGWYVDQYFDDWWNRARAANVPLLGAYYVNHPGDQIAQADYFLSQLDSRAPGWRDLPAFILQLDAEWFPYMDRAPTPAENKAFLDRLVSRTGGRYRPLLYAPGWLYGTSLAGLGYPLWESDYGTNPTVHYRSAYPGDGSSRWLYGPGMSAALLQYGSRLTIGSQTICDANAFRGTLAQLKDLVMGGSDMNDEERTWLKRVHQRQYGLAFLLDEVPLEYGEGITQLPLSTEIKKISAAVATIRADLATFSAYEKAADAAQQLLLEKLAANESVPLTPEELEALKTEVKAAAQEAAKAEGDRVMAELKRQEAEREAALRAALDAETTN